MNIEAISRRYRAARTEPLLTRQAAVTFVRLWTALAVWAVISTCAAAADVRLDAPIIKSYVGLPIPFRIEIRNSSYHDPPSVKRVDGLDIRLVGQPVSSTRSQIVQDANGIRRQSTSSITYNYRITAKRAGKFTIPPIRVKADGVATVTKAITVEIAESETGDLLFLEIESENESVFVGQPLKLTMKILLKQFVDEDLEVGLSKSSMWQLVRTESQWGAFTEKVEALRDEQRLPSCTVVSLKDADGNMADYFSYEIETVIYPTRPGTIDSDDVNVIVHYPVQLDQRPDPFSGISNQRLMRGLLGGGLFGPQLEISEVRPITATASIDSVIVKPIPVEGRPDTYRGAVGHYQIVTDATPTSCGVDDPIQLLIAIDGSGPLEGVRAPDLANNQALTKDFKVLDEPLGGFVDGKRKVFSTTIRPRDVSVTSIPPIEYSYFDPDAQEFVTVQSLPIPISVEQAEVLSLGALPESPKGLDETPNDEVGSASATGPAFTGNPESLLAQQRAAERWPGWLIGLLVMPPAIAMLSQVVFWRKRFFELLRRFVPPERELLRCIGSSDDRSAVADAVQQYLARVTGQSERLVAIGTLRSMGRLESAILAERIYAKCESPVVTAASEKDCLQTLKSDAIRLSETISDHSSQRRPIRQRSSKTASLVSKSRAGGSSLLILGILLFGPSTVQGNDKIELSREQAVTLLRDAIDILGHIDPSVDDKAAAEQHSAEQQSAYQQAAESFRTVIESGVSNTELHYLAGTAFAAAGKRGESIVEFRRALRLNPTHHASRIGLHQQVRPGTSFRNTSGTASGQWLRTLRHWKDRLISIVPLKTFAVLFASAWIALWIILALRWAHVTLLGWGYAVCAIGISIAAGWIYVDSVFDCTSDDVAVLVVDRVEIREADGPEQPIVATLEDADGRVVHELARRNGWVQIATELGTGWIPDRDVESVST
tara:strand:+ start:10865 stop:13696 length:2832 start_codon:yes stop_codon:yes gene_type:complete